MWRCARCGARNSREDEHCTQCGMPNPFGDGGQTKTMDLPPVRVVEDPPPEPPRPWLPILIGVGVIVVVAFLLILLVG